MNRIEKWNDETQKLGIRIGFMTAVLLSSELPPSASLPNHSISRIIILEKSEK